MPEKIKESKDASGAILPPPVIFAIVLLISYGLQRGQPDESLPDPLRLYLGLALAVVAIVLAGLCIRAFWRQKTSVDPYKPVTALVVEGPFQFSRNPMYIALTLLYLGIAIYFGLVWALLLLPFALATIHYGVIIREESYLERKFGEDYLAYKSRVRRWI